MRRFFMVPVLLLVMSSIACAEETFQFGFSKVDITPDEPVRLSGYGGRNKPYEKVREKIYVRTMAIQSSTETISLLLTVDNVGFPAEVTKQIALEARRQHKIPRGRIVISCSHTHSAPHLTGALPNLFSYPIPKEEQRVTDRYTRTMMAKVVDGMNKAIAKLAPGKIYYAKGKATFARNRRLFKNGVRVGGVNEAGPVDHTLPILKIAGTDGKTRGIMFNYACHCTSLGINEVSGDWAGYACKYIEKQTPDCVAMCTIGCGADVNPIRTRVQGEDVKLATAAGQEIADVVKEITSKEMVLLSSKFTTSFDYAKLKPDPYPMDVLKKNLKSSTPQKRMHAEHFLELIDQKKSITKPYSDPVHVWRFGDQLVMVFMGGETVIDYSIRLHKEINVQNLWVSSYCDDVFAYVASERVRKEGGYEADRSMIYYLQPGPWATGTEDIVIKKVHQLVKQTVK